VSHQSNVHLDNVSFDILSKQSKNVPLRQISSCISIEGYSQTVFIDPRFINSIKIIDVNTSVVEVSAVEISSIGSVVKAKTHFYSRQNELGLSHCTTKNNWNEFYTDEDLLTECRTGSTRKASETLTFTAEFQHLNSTGSDKKTGSDTYEVRNQSYTLSWNINVTYRFNTDFDTVFTRVSNE
jgi:hypothetical protein